MSGAKVPPTLKPIAHYIKIANENANRDPVIYYWCLYHAVQSGLQIDKSSPDALSFLTSLLGTLEAIKKQLGSNDAIINDVVAQAHIENFAMKLFDYADKKEKAGQIDKSVVHAFYTAGHVMDTLAEFGEIDEPYASAKKYAKWKSTQIFACLRDGTPYIPSTQQENEDASAPSNPFHSVASQPIAPPPTGPTQAHDEFGLPTIPSHSQPQPARPQVPTESAYPADISQNSQPPSKQLPVSSNSGSKVPSFEEWEHLRKFAKYALSAIDYEDIKTVADNLRHALAIVERYE